MRGAAFFSFWPDGRRVSSKGYFGDFRALTADKYPALGIGHHTALQVVELNGSIGISLSRNPLYSGQRTVRTDIEIQCVALQAGFGMIGDKAVAAVLMNSIVLVNGNLIRTVVVPFVGILYSTVVELSAAWRLGSRLRFLRIMEFAPVVAFHNNRIAVSLTT